MRRRFRIWERRNLAAAGSASSGLAVAVILLGAGDAEFVFVELFLVLDQRHGIVIGGVADGFFLLGEAFRDFLAGSRGLFVFVVGAEDRFRLGLGVYCDRFLDFFLFV